MTHRINVVGALAAVLVTVLSTPSSIALGTTELFIPGAAHAGGVNDANWRSDLQIANAGDTGAQFTVELMPADMDNSSRASATFSVNPGQSMRYMDILDSMFSFSGAGALRITSASDNLLVTSRTYNSIGANSVGLPVGASFGQWVPAILLSDAITPDQEGRLIMLTQTDPGTYSGFRTNVGVVNASSSAVDFTIEIYSKTGAKLGTTPTADGHLPAYGFHQFNQPGAVYGPLDDFYAVVRPSTSGAKILAFATVVDNHVTGDPIMIPAMRMTSLPPPQLTVTGPTHLLMGDTPTFMVSGGVSPYTWSIGGTGYMSKTGGTDDGTDLLPKVGPLGV